MTPILTEELITAAEVKSGENFIKINAVAEKLTELIKTKCKQ